MGGPGSGRRPSFPTTLDDLRAVDLRYLRRHGMLEPGRCGTLRWSRAGRETGSVGFTVDRDALTLTYRTRGHSGEGWTEVVEPVRLSRTAQPFGGERAWFACPGCSRRCAVLYGGRHFLCRCCVALPYGSQHEPAHERRHGKDQAALDGRPLRTLPAAAVAAHLARRIILNHQVS